MGMVDQVAEKERRPPLRRGDVVGRPVLRVFAAPHGVAEAGQQLLQLAGAAVHVADDVEGAGEAAPIGPERHAFDFRRVGLLGRVETVDVADPLAAEAAQRAAQRGQMVAHHVGAELPVRSKRVAFVAELARHVEDEADGQRVEALRQGDQGAAVLRADIGRVDHGQTPRRHALGGNEVDQVEGVARGGLVVLVVGDQAAAGVGGDDLGGLEVAAREGRFAGARGSDQQDQAEIGDGQAHRLNTAICVGAPRSGSNSPMSWYRTV